MEQDRRQGHSGVMFPIYRAILSAPWRDLALWQGDPPWLFLSGRGEPLTWQTVSYLVGSTTQSAGLPGVRPHTFRHSCGYYLANKGCDLRLIQGYLGHRNPKHTVRYTRMVGRLFEEL